ncbi:MAG: hypothetical protein QOK01_1026 [Alphaproteobacteria bacterium]|jgi:hypothetical protein|nr:hypothetical protein [Alphaproteobacteria bacterium]
MSNPAGVAGWRPERSHPGGRRRLADAANDAADGW